MDDAAPPKPRRARGPTSSDPIEMAMQAEAADGSPDSPARGLLIDQRRLVRWQIAGERAGVALKLLTAAAGLAAAMVLAVMAFNASQDRRVLIDPIRTPPDLVQQGSDPTVVANALQDKIVALQKLNVGLAGSTLQQSQTTELKVQIPATGISISDLDQALRSWLGHATHVTGELSRPAAGPDKGALVLSLRVAGDPGVRLVQPDGDLDALLRKGAEQAYRVIDPIPYAAWLGRAKGDREGAAALLRQLTQEGPPERRAFAYQMLANSTRMTEPPAVRAVWLKEAIRLSHGAAGINDFGVTEGDLGHSESAFKAMQQAERSRRAVRADSPLTAETQAANHLIAVNNLQGYRGEYHFVVPCQRFKIDPCEAERLTAAMEQAARLGPIPVDDRAWEGVRSLARAHAGDLGAKIAAVWPVKATDAGADAQLRADRDRLMGVAELHREREEWQALLADADEWDALAKIAPAFDVPQYPRLNRPLAMAKLGDPAGAERAAAALPGDCYRCLIARGRVAALRGDRAGADRWFAEAARQAPSLPFAETDWARALLDRGQADRAAATAAKAAAKAPRYADPYGIWGEALLAKGAAAGAVAKLSKAAELTPRWGRAHLKLGEALAKRGKTAEAQAEWRLAANLFLTASECAELARVQGAR